MKICILACSTLVHQMGGAEVHCQTMSETAVKMGHAVVIITTRHPKGVEYEEKNGCGIYYLPDTRPARMSKSFWEESAKKINQLYGKYQFDIIWAENQTGYYYAWKIKPQLQIPVISILQGLGIWGHIRSEWNHVSSYGGFVNFMGKRLPETVFGYIPWFYRTLKYSDAIVGISEQTVEAMKKEFGVDERKIFIVHDGVDIDLFKPDEQKREFIRRKFSLSPDDKVLLMAGVVYQQKGMHIGLRAFAQIRKRIPRPKMMIVGDGAQLEELKRMSKNLDLENDVIFCGLIPNEETANYYNAADLFLNPTIRQEGLSIVTVEAMACAKPVVISRIGGTQSTIDDGISGFFVQPKDVKSLADRAVEILSNPLLAKQMGECGRKKAMAKFSQEKMISDYVEISQRIINQKGEL